MEMFLVSTVNKCPKISYAKVSDKIAFADSADPDQTAPWGAVWSGSTLLAIPLNVFGNNYIEKQILSQNRIKCLKFYDIYSMHNIWFPGEMRKIFIWIWLLFVETRVWENSTKSTKFKSGFLLRLLFF